ncbi:MAG: FHA domain-containing protein [Pseudomonadota bacterium]|jgi:Inner membrane component of T3SS, cytoplasmic domain|nr:FHA domain-containing protein [Pseudomonadota bacterium]
MKVALTVIKGPAPGRVMEFHEPRGFILGRAKDADFQLSPDDPYVGRRHAYLEICPPSCRLRDLGSTNPTHVNGMPVTECELADGDVLELGYTQLKVSIAAQIARYVKYCDACGQAIELLPDETEPEICLVCAEKARRAVQPAPIVVPTVCSLCWLTDLSAQANSDGRAAELQGVAVYACEKCLPERDEWAGSMIGDYAVLRRLGEGGMGIVYLVYHRPTARLWALKQMKDLRDALLVKRFEREYA